MKIALFYANLAGAMLSVSFIPTEPRGVFILAIALALLFLANAAWLGFAFEKRREAS